MKLTTLLGAIVVVGLILSGNAAIASVHAGDQLYVTVYDHPELTGIFSIDASERLSMPLVGSVDIHGLSENTIAKKIRARLAVYILRPAVSVQLKDQQASLFVSGGPGGVLKYDPGETLVAALGELSPRVTGISSKGGGASSGDLDDLQRTRIDLRRVGIVRDSKSLGQFDIQRLVATGQPAPRLLPGDTIVLVDKPRSVRVLGEVAHPGVAYLADDESLDNALIQSGGLLPTAATTEIGLHRDGSDNFVSLSDPRFNLPPHDGDVVTVPIAPHVSIAGLVERPGTLVLKTEPTLLSALYEAGGPSHWADLKHVEVVDQNVKASYDITRLINGDLSQNPKLKDGDLVFVPEGHKLSFASIFQNILSLSILHRL